MPTLTLLEAVAVTAELCGRTFSEPAARVFVADLAAYPEDAVLKALTRCRKEVRGALTVADVVQRIDDVIVPIGAVSQRLAVWGLWGSTLPEPCVASENQ